MTFTWDGGQHITNDDPVDDRMVFDTVAEVLETLAFGRRFDGLSIWIRKEKRKYRFIGGTANSHFVPDLVGPGSMVWRVD
jgi:hypothetical protein